jgi:AcrR family transcriptional regulator
MKKNLYMKISELSRLTNVPKSTIRFYLREGLLHAPLKTGRTMAYYDESHLRRIKIIQKLKKEARLPVAFLKEHIEEMETTLDRQADRRSPDTEDRRVVTTNQKERRRDDILKAASRVFTQKGYHGTKVSDITEAAGISTGTFYFYFGDKLELFKEVVGDILNYLNEKAAVVLREEKDFIGRSVARARLFHEYYNRYAEIMFLLRAEMAGEEPWPREKVEEIYDEITRPIIRDLEQGMKSGGFRKMDPKLTAYALVGMFEVMVLFLQLDNRYSLDQIIEFTFDFFMRGLQTPEKDVGMPEKR